MAAAYVDIYCNGIPVRTFGGNRSDVRMMKQEYERMSKEEFLTRHPKFADECKDRCEITCFRYNN